MSSTTSEPSPAVPPTHSRLINEAGVDSSGIRGAWQTWPGLKCGSVSASTGCRACWLSTSTTPSATAGWACPRPLLPRSSAPTAAGLPLVRTRRLDRRPAARFREDAAECRDRGHDRPPGAGIPPGDSRPGRRPGLRRAGWRFAEDHDVHHSWRPLRSTRQPSAVAAFSIYYMGVNIGA